MLKGEGMNVSYDTSSGRKWDRGREFESDWNTSPEFPAEHS
jgi:hypothetical protein